MDVLEKVKKNFEVGEITNCETSYLIEQAEKVEKIRLLIRECNNKDRAVQPYEILDILNT